MVYGTYGNKEIPTIKVAL